VSDFEKEKVEKAREYSFGDSDLCHFVDFKAGAEWGREWEKKNGYNRPSGISSLGIIRRQQAKEKERSQILALSYLNIPLIHSPQCNENGCQTAKCPFAIRRYALKKYRGES